MSDATRHAVGRYVSQALSFSAVLILLLSALLVLSDPAPAEGGIPTDSTSIGARP